MQPVRVTGYIFLLTVNTESGSLMVEILRIQPDTTSGEFQNIVSSFKENISFQTQKQPQLRCAGQPKCFLNIDSHTTPIHGKTCIIRFSIYISENV